MSAPAIVAAMTNPLFETWVGLNESLTYQRTLTYFETDPFLPGEAAKPRVPSNAPDSIWRAHFDEEMAVRRCRQELVQRFSWAVPSPCAIRRLVELGPIVEVGAGLGYWARCVADAGGEIVATDSKGDDRSGYHPEPFEFFDVIELDAVDAARKWSDRTLLLVWPPYNWSMAERALLAYLRAGGQTLVYVGERYGCTATERFERLLGLVFGEEDERVPIPQWDGIHDAMHVFHRAAS